MFPQDVSFLSPKREGSSKGAVFIDKEINQRGNRMCKDPLSRNFSGLSGRKPEKERLLTRGRCPSMWVHGVLLKNI